MVEVINSPNIPFELSENIENVVENSDCQKEKVERTNILSNFQTKLVWPNVIGFFILHVLGIIGLFKLFALQVQLYSVLFSCFFSYYVGQCVTIGAHRLWAHRSFKARLPLKILLLIGQTSSGQNSVWEWSRDHRQHHKYSDTDADPHNSKRGFFFSHMGWLMMKKHPEVIKNGKNIDMSDLDADPWVMFQKKYYKILYFFLGFLIPTYILVILCEETITNALLLYFGRYITLLNVTWSVNSVAHFFGTRPYTKDIKPVQTRFVSFLTSGEGWHNYHHTFPWDYKAAEFGTSYNANSTFIEWCEKFGLAYDLKTATPEMVAQRIKSKGDGTLIPFSEFNSKTKLK